VSVNRLVVVAGPTGTGKSEVALDLAERLDGEIVNADSMQLYRGMDIGTAKVPPGQRRGIPHHLLDVLDIRQRASVAAYQSAARRQIEAVLSRGGTPLLVGGSGLYINAVIDDIEFPGTDPAVRAALESELAERGAEPLFQRLRTLDPAAAAVIEPANGRRLVRALEVMIVTGRPFSATLPVPGPPRYDALLICLDRETTSLDERLQERVEGMVAAGFLDEVRGLAAAGLREGVTASRALGYPQMLAVLDGLVELGDAVAETVRLTRRFVRRQRSWFGRDLRMHRVDAGVPDLAAQLAALAMGTADPARTDTTAQ
jgi:tRNA dimethylallyltransferase